jgi:hypothetical protein
LLSPEEENDLVMQLSNGGWSTAVKEMVSQEGTPTQLVPPNDWRYEWTLDVLRRLEAALCILGQEPSNAWTAAVLSDVPMPSPVPYPLQVGPGAHQYLSSLREVFMTRHIPPARHAVTGAPYSLVVVQDSSKSNAFSYGFGPEGAGGIVVYSGFLDEILSRDCPLDAASLEPELGSSWWQSLTNGFSLYTADTSRPQRAPSHVHPTSQQTSDLAIVLAHELAHLILAHHLETLSFSTIVVPGFLSLVTDSLRILLFPFTMMFGPFVNDALANVGRTGSLDYAAIRERCASISQEFEADAVSLRFVSAFFFRCYHFLILSCPGYLPTLGSMLVMPYAFGSSARSRQQQKVRALVPMAHSGRRFRP